MARKTPIVFVKIKLIKLHPEDTKVVNNIKRQLNYNAMKPVYIYRNNDGSFESIDNQSSQIIISIQKTGYTHVKSVLLSEEDKLSPTIPDLMIYYPKPSITINKITSRIL